MQAEVPMIYARRSSTFTGSLGALPAHRTNPAGVRIDQCSADGGSGQQAERYRAFRQQALAERCARFDDFTADPPTIADQEVREPDPLEVATAPPPLMSEISPLAGQRAGRPRGSAGRAIGEIIGKIEEVSGRVIGRRQMLLEPEELWRFHLRRNDAADMAQHFVAGRADAIRLRDRPVIHPDDDVVAREA